LTPGAYASLLTLKLSGVQRIHLAVKDATTGRAGWLLLEDVRVYHPDAEPWPFSESELTPWAEIERIDAELSDIRPGARNRAEPPPGASAAWIGVDRYRTLLRWFPPRAYLDLDYVGGPNADLPEVGRFFRLLGSRTRALCLALSTEELAPVLGKMYPDGTKLPRLALSLTGDL
jgi:hypothetical protein